MTDSTLDKLKKYISYIISISLIFLIWIIAAKKTSSALILPYPVEVAAAMGKLFQNPEFWTSFLHTFLRCIISFGISLVLGIILGTVCALSSFCKRLFELPIAIVRATPVAAIILIVLFWFKSNTVPIFVSVLMTLPIMITSVVTGLSSSDKKLLDMAQCFSLTKKDIFYYIKLPSAIPFILNGSVSAFGLTWKVVVAGEVLSLPINATGTLLQLYQVHLESAYVLATAIILVAFSFFLQELFAFFVRRYLKKL